MTPVARFELILGLLTVVVLLEVLARRLRLPPSAVLVLGGVVNDATGLVLFRIAVAAGMTGAFNGWAALASFGLLSTGGVIVGVAYGWAVASVLWRVCDPLLNIAGGLLGAWSAYILGEALHVSGVLSTVSCGLVLGLRQHDLLAASVRTQANAVWAMLVFLLEALIFILIGFSLRGVLARLEAASVPLESMAIPVGAIAVAMILARFAWIVPATYLPRFLLPSLRRRDPYPPFAVPVVMSWAGMRGVVSLAVALSLPEQFPGRDVLLASTLALILISILLQGTTLAPLIRFMSLEGFQLETRSTLSEAEARLLLSRAALSEIQARSHAPDGHERHPRLLEQYTYRAEMTDQFLRSQGQLSSHRQEHFQTILAANRASRAALLALHRSARIHDSVLQILEAELDLEELGARHAIPVADE